MTTTHKFPPQVHQQPTTVAVAPPHPGGQIQNYAAAAAAPPRTIHIDTANLQVGGKLMNKFG